MTLKELETRRQELAGKLRGINEKLGEYAAKDEITAGETRNLADLERAAEKASAELADVRVKMTDAALAGVANGSIRTESGDGAREGAPNFHRTADRFGSDFDGGQLRSDALRMIQAQAGAETLPDAAVEKLTNAIEQQDDWAPMSRYVRAAADPNYLSAYLKLMADPRAGGHLWTGEEREAFSRAQYESRALSLTDASGGYLVPTHLDPAVIITTGGTNNVIRLVSKVNTIATNTWNGVASAGVTAEWLAEASVAADASPTFSQPSIPTHKAFAWIPYSFEVGDDAAMFAANMAELLTDARDRLEATAFTTGNGTTAPQGFVTGLVGSAAEINSVGSETFTSPDVYATLENVGARHRSRAVWMASLPIINDIRQFETTNGARLFPGLEQNPMSLLGRPFYESSDMDGTILTNATANNYVLCAGNFAQGYQIVDRIGATTEIVANLIDGTTGRPTGQRGVIYWFRTGAEVVNVNAFSLLDVPTSGA